MNPFTGKSVAPMIKLSPAAEAIWNTYNAAFDEAGVFTDYGDALAAALRALADQVVPANGSRKNNEIRAEILAIAAELEGNTEPTLTPEEVEMIAAPWSYLQSQQELESGVMTNPRNLIQRLVNALDDRIDDFEERMYPGEGYMPLIAEARNYLAGQD